MARPADGAWPARRRFRVTYHDVDALNHLNHAVYFQFMETLRCDYYLPLRHSTDPRDLDIILAEADCRFLAPAAYATELLGEVAPARPLGRTSFTLVYRFRNPDSPSTVYARGRTAIVCYDYATGAKKPIEPDVRARLETDAIDASSEGWTDVSPRPNRSPA
ncbi:MAG TPA: thioesterase family protein [Thermoplasmata archaeon]|nr:thioesterase family protein [Thermoplasmata archaeon]